MPSPTCTVNATATADGVNVSAASTPTIALVSAAGVTTWSISCIYTDETNTAAAINATLSVNTVAKTATFTAPATTGSAMIFRSVVNGGVDANGTTQPSYTTTFKVCVLTSGGKRVAAFGETTENDSDFGWTGILNDYLRTGSTGVPTGTGFRHITAGNEDAAAKLVENADVHASAAIAGTKISPDFGSQNIVTTGACSLGTTPSTAGTFRLPNAGTIQFRNAANGANLQALSIDGSNICQVGNATGATTITGSTVGVTGNTTVTGTITGTSTLSVGSTPATSGTVALPNAGTVQFRNQANGANLQALSIDSSNICQVGNATGASSVNGLTLTLNSTGSTTAYCPTSATWTFANSSAEVTADRFAQRRIESVQTTDATVTSLWTLAATASSVQYVEARVVAIDSGGTKTRAWKIACTYYGSTPTKLGSHVVLEDYSNSDSAAWALDFDVSGGSLRLRATGAAATTIRWTCDVQVLRTKN